MWQELARILAVLITQYQKLKQLNEEKHGILVLVKMQELEKLVMSVMKKELGAVIYLGALVGFLIGLLNLIF